MSEFHKIWIKEHGMPLLLVALYESQKQNSKWNREFEERIKSALKKLEPLSSAGEGDKESGWPHAEQPEAPSPSLHKHTKD